MNQIDSARRSAARKISLFLLLVFTALSPFHAFFITYLKTFDIPGGLFNAIAAWREITVVLLGIVALIHAVGQARKNGWHMLSLRLAPRVWEVPIWLLILFGIAWFPFQDTSVLQWAFGVRVDLVFWVALIVAARLPFEHEDVTRIMRVFFYAGIIVLALGIIHAVFLPQDFLFRFGYSINRDIWDIEASIAACQFLEHTKALCRATSTFGGPIRFGTYLLLILAFLPALKNSFASGRSRLAKAVARHSGAATWILFALAVTNLVLTFSRSAWIGGGALLIDYLFTKYGKNLKRYSRDCMARHAVAALIGLIIVAILAMQLPIVKTIVIRTDSTSEHFQLMREGLEFALSHPLGIGLGTVGPASLRFPTPERERFITENWYLQMAIEFGIAGLIVFLCAIWSVLRALVACKPDTGKSAMLGLIALLALSFFTHGFEETTTVLLLFIFAGLSLRAPHASSQHAPPHRPR